MMNDYDVVIIDPSSTEFNRGSFCYLPYILYSALKEEDVSVMLVEDFTASGMDTLPRAKEYLISLWSYPQLDLCFVLNRFLTSKKSFFGYYSLIKEYHLPLYVVSDALVLKGIESYPKYYHCFKHLLLSDCDMHLKKYSGQVYPFFTSYGCPRGCSFCPTSVNCGRRRVVIPTTRVKMLLENCRSAGIFNIHFTDEDFFYDIERTYELLSCAGNDMKFITLGSVDRVRAFIRKYGCEILEDSGVKLIEIGFEAADESLLSLMRKSSSVDQCERLVSELGSVKPFWLTLTFFPGETIDTIACTGRFLSRFGYDLGDLYGRIATNSTEGGLGQFFQLYHGVREYDSLVNKGRHISDRPIRLIPSFLPYSFLSCIIEQVRDICEDDLPWFNLYGLLPLMEMESGKTVDEIIMMMQYVYDVPDRDSAVYLAVCARLGILRCKRKG